MSSINYEIPEWFSNAKFGIFIHWGIYSVPAFGDEWYGHWMYIPNSKCWAGDDIYTYHQQHHKGKGYKDFIKDFTGEKFDAKEWMDLFVEAGAKYVVPVAIHHDSFAMYDSRLTRWKATAMGPKVDYVRKLYEEAKKRGLKFGVSQHFAENWWFFPHVEGLDTSEEEYFDLYNVGKGEEKTSQEHLDRWYGFSKELIDMFEPDMLYYDFEIAKDDYKEKRYEILKYYYEKQKQWNKGVVLSYKYGAFQEGEALLDVERGGLSEIRKLPWQTCTSIGDKSWGYVENDRYKTPLSIIQTLIDTVSKNGCLLLNVSPKADGTIPEGQVKILKEIGSWLKVYGESIYNTRPYKVYGEGETKAKDGALSEGNTAYTKNDIRFTVSQDKKSLYAIFMAPTDKDGVTIKNVSDNKITSVSLLGYGGLSFERADDGLLVKIPKDKINGPYALKISSEDTWI